MSDLQAWLQDFVRASLAPEAVDRFVSEIDDEIVRTLPELADDRMLLADLHVSTRSQWLAFLATVDRPKQGLDLPEGAVDLARSIALRGYEARVLLRIYLSAHHGVFKYFTDAIDSLGGGFAEREEALRYLWQRGDRWMDDSLELLMEIYLQERQGRQDAAALRRLDFVDHLLAGEQPTTDEASRALGHPMNGWHIGVLLWQTGADSGADTRIQRAAARLTQALPGTSLLAQPSGSREMRCWLSSPSCPDIDQLSRAWADLEQDISVAVGIAGRGVIGFRVSHQEARAAQEVALAFPRPQRHVAYADVELLSLTMGRSEAFERMALRELGDLAADGEALEPIRQTVLEFLRAGRNVKTAANALHVHENTVRYRLTRAEAILGRDLTARTGHLELALQWASLQQT